MEESSSWRGDLPNAYFNIISNYSHPFHPIIPFHYVSKCLPSTSSECPLLLLYMQSSKGSLKLEAHRDKVINQEALSTKRRFLLDEIAFLAQLIDQAQALQQCAKPTTEPHSQPSHLSRKARQLCRDLTEEVTYTRRQISLEQVSDGSAIQARIAQQYEISIEALNRKLELMEGKVQSTEEKKKSNGALRASPSAPFKLPEDQKLLEDSLAQRGRIKALLKKRLMLSGAIRQLQGKQKHQLVLSKGEKHPASSYIYLTRHLPLYRHPSAGHLTNAHQRNTRPKKSKSPLVLNNFYLQALQCELFLEELERLKNTNGKLQVLVSRLQQALTQKEEERLLRQLTTGNKELRMEQMLAREVFAFRRMSLRFQQRLEKASFMWVFSPKQAPPKPNSKEQCAEEARRVERREAEGGRRSRSVERYEGEVLFLRGEASKSNGKTCSSLEAIHA